MMPYMPQPWNKIGFWWQPVQDAPEDQASTTEHSSEHERPSPPVQSPQLSTGTLNFDGRKSITLTDVAGPLAAISLVDETGAPTGVRAPRIILGTSHTGEKFTCLGNYYTKSSQHPIGGIPLANLDVQVLLEGGHFSTTEDLAFRSLSCIYSNLHTWLFDVPHIESQQISGNDRAYQITHVRNQLWSVTTPEGYTLGNDHSFTRNYTYAPEPTWTFSHRDGFRVTCSEPRSTREMLALERKFRTLANFLGDFQLDITSLRFRQDNSILSNNISYYDRGLVSNFSHREDAKRGIMPVSYSDIAENFSNICTQWLLNYNALEPIVNLYLFGKHNPYLDIGNTFLGLMQSLEAYHRSFHAGVFMPQTEYLNNVAPVVTNAIPTTVQGSFRQRLIAAVRFGYEYSFRKRLKDLIDELPNTSTFNQMRDANFKARTVDTRNSLTHQVESSDMQIMEGGQLYEAIQIWREALFALVLGRIGLDVQTIDRAVQRMQYARGTFVSIA